MLPQVTVELFQTEIVHFFHIKEDALFQNAHGILHGTLVLGLLHLGRENDSVVMFGPFGVILIQLRIDPVLVGNDSLLAVVAHDQGRNTAEILQRIVVDGDPLRLLGGDHALRIDVLGIREDGNENHNVQNLTGQMIHHLEGLSGKIHFHLLSNDSIEV